MSVKVDYVHVRNRSGLVTSSVNIGLGWWFLRGTVMLKAVWVSATVVAAIRRRASAQNERRVIRVTAERFSFTPSRIRMEVGEPVELWIRSDDTSHGYRIAELDIDVTLPKRGQGEAKVPLQLDVPGRYTFECSRMCGAGHNLMRGELVVRERTHKSGPQ